ncbi:MAG: hypothetical protein LH632_11390 [Rhodoferax sp.]|nr:hypothetical protein [Rhodoferax sp.]
MSDLLTASENLTLSRQRMRQVLAESAAAPHTSDNPLLVAGTFAKEAVETAVHPFAQRNPLGLVAGAVLVGGLLAWSRPWRWLLTPVVASMLPVFVTRMVRAAPAETWMKALTALTRPRQRQTVRSQPLRPHT